MYVIILKRSITKQQDNYLTIERRTSEKFECVVPVNPQRLKGSVLMKKNNNKNSNSARQLTSEKFLPKIFIRK